MAVDLIQAITAADDWRRATGAPGPDTDLAALRAFAGEANPLGGWLRKP